MEGFAQGKNTPKRCETTTSKPGPFLYTDATEACSCLDQRKRHNSNLVQRGCLHLRWNEKSDRFKTRGRRKREKGALNNSQYRRCRVSKVHWGLCRARRIFRPQNAGLRLHTRFHQQQDYRYNNRLGEPTFRVSESTWGCTRYQVQWTYLWLVRWSRCKLWA